MTYFTENDLYSDINGQQNMNESNAVNLHRQENAIQTACQSTTTMNADNIQTKSVQSLQSMVQNKEVINGLNI